MSEYIGETVRVGAVFFPEKIEPKWFLRQNRKILIKAITYVWQEKTCDASLIHFCVSDGTNLYELCLNQAKLTWTLERSE